MTIKRKTNITLLILGFLALFFIIFVVNPIFGGIKEESQNLIAQKNQLAEFEVKINNLQDFKSNFDKYRSDLEKIDGLLIDPAEPIGFIEFLETEATSSRLSIKIAPPVLQKATDGSWPVMDFRLNLEGGYPGFLRFLERLESSPYLINVVNLNTRKSPDIKSNDIMSDLLINVYAK